MKDQEKPKATWLVTIAICVALVIIALVLLGRVNRNARHQREVQRMLPFKYTPSE